MQNWNGAPISRAVVGAQSLVGAVIGDLYVKDRTRPGKRWLYVVNDTGTGRDHYLRGHEVVRLVREAIADDKFVIMPATPWESRQKERNRT